MGTIHNLGIDTGNRCIKTANHVFVSGLKTTDTEPPFNQGVLEYGGRYHMLSRHRVAYLEDKTVTDEYFVLALYGIAMELESRGVDITCPIKVRLGVGLPPAHISRLRTRFRDYFSRGRVRFSLDMYEFVIDIVDVVVMAQAFAAIYDDFAAVKEYTRAYIIDIGGYTTDVLLIKHGRLDPDFYQSFDMGVIGLYNQIYSNIRSQYGLSLDEDQIDAMLSNTTPVTELDEFSQIRETVSEIADLYINDMLRRFNEYGMDIAAAKPIFAGGGAIRLLNKLEQTGRLNRPYFISDISANAKGYESFLSLMNRA